MIKKLVMIFGVLFLLLLGAALVIPFVVDVDRYRPKLIDIVNQNIHGKFDLGKLKLSLWGQVRVEIAGVSIVDRAGKKLLSVNDAFLHIPFSSILGGSPLVVFKMDRPMIYVMKDKSGKINLLELMKSQQEKAQEKSTSPSSNIALPALVVRARVDMDMKNAQLIYADATTGLDTKLTDLNFSIHDVSLSRPMKMSLRTHIDTRLGKLFEVKGPIEFSAQAKPEIVDGKFDHMDMNSKLNMDQLLVQAPELFEKKPGIPFGADFVARLSQKEAKLQDLTARLHTVSLSASGTVSNIGEEGKSPIVNMGLKSNSIEMKSWVELVPMLKDFQLSGTAQLNAGVNGPSDQLGYAGSFKIADFVAQSPRLKSKPKVDALVHFKTDQIEKMIVTVKAPGNDLQVQGSLVSFKKPKLDMSITSSGMDLDQLVDFPSSPVSSGGQGAVVSGKTGSASASSPTKTDYDAMLASLRESSVMKEFSGLLDINIKQIKVYDVRLLEILSKVTVKDLVFSVDHSSMKVWNGTITANKRVDFKPKAPAYQFGVQVKGLDMAKAMESQVKLFKNTLIGKADFAMNGSGSSLNPDLLIDRLNVKGNMKIAHAKFATIDIGRMVTEALNNSISSIAQKVPALNGKKIQNLPNAESYYEWVTADFTLANGHFSSPNFYAKAEAQKGIDLKGNTDVGMKDYSLNARWEVVDTYDLTGAKKISVEQQGVHIDSILAEKNGPVRFPVSVGCTLTSPCYKYGEVPEYLGKIALANVGNAIAGRAKAEAQKKVESIIQQHAPPAVQNQLNDLGKKLFGN